MSKQIVGDYLGRIFEFDTEIYAALGIAEELAINLARCGIFPDDLLGYIFEAKRILGK